MPAKWLGLAVLAALAVASSRSAAAVPALSPEHETVLVGAEVSPKGGGRGTWRQEPGRLSLEAPDASGQSVWLAEGGELADGFGRWSFTDWRDSGARLLLRARLDASRAFGLSGYVLALSTGGLELWRVDDGVTRPTGFAVKARELAKATSLEVVVWMVGPHGSAQVFDGRALGVAPLASLAWTDTRYASGRVGVLADHREGKCHVTTGLSLRAAGLAAPSSSRLDVRVPGPWRFLFLDEARWAGAEPELRAAARVLDGADADGRLLVRADEAAAERLRRAGLVTGRLEADTPLRLVDDGFREARAVFEAGRPGTGRAGAWHDGAMLRATLEQVVAKAPRASLHELGRTREGRPILALHLAARRPDAPSVLLLGGIHGSELIGPEIVLDAVRRLGDAAGDAQVRGWRDRVDVWAVPDANPDGRAAYLDTSIYQGRKNGGGVDLNRNFPFAWGEGGDTASKGVPEHEWYRGPSAGSEPEVQALLRLAERERFVASLSFHSKGTLLLYPYQAHVAAGPSTDEARAIAEELGASLPAQANGRRVRVTREMYPVAGVAEDTLRHAYGTLALLFEAADDNPDEPARRLRLLDDARPAWQGLLRRVAEGPRLSVKVVDAKGRPLSATVSVVGEQSPLGEAWTTRCRDGRFDRLLAGERPVRVRVEAGGVAKERTLAVAPGARGPVTLTLAVGDAPGTACRPDDDADTLSRAPASPPLASPRP